MRTNSFENLIKAMTITQQTALQELERAHGELLWDGGKVETYPLRVSIKNADGNNMAAINTREKKAFLRLEFRSKDYNSPNITIANHRNFDRAFDLINSSSVKEASGIISIIKQKYLK